MTKIHSIKDLGKNRKRHKFLNGKEQIGSEEKQTEAEAERYDDLIKWMQQQQQQMQMQNFQLIMAQHQQTNFSKPDKTHAACIHTYGKPAKFKWTIMPNPMRKLG